MSGGTPTPAQRIVHILSEIIPGGAPLHEPEFAGNEWDYVKECLDTGWVSTAGAFVGRFEEKLAAYTGAAHAVATVNGTAALHTCLVLAGVGRDDEVIVPTLTFVATANAVAYCGAHPHFADSDERTLGLDPAKLEAHLGEIAEVRDGGCHNRETGRRIAALMCVHVFGHPCDLDALVGVCKRWGLPLIEDAAESLGSFYKGRHTGNHGLLAALSFNGNKTVTSGGGGAILTNDAGLAVQAKHLTTTAKLDHPWDYNHDRVGFNYRLPNINAALGLAQLERLPGFLERKRKLAETYEAAFAPVSGVRFFTEPDFARSNYWLNLLLLDSRAADARDDILEMTNDAGFMTRPAWSLLHRLPMYRSSPRMDLSVAEDISARLIAIPSSPRLTGPGDG